MCGPSDMKLSASNQADDFRLPIGAERGKLSKVVASPRSGKTWQNVGPVGPGVDKSEYLKSFFRSIRAAKFNERPRGEMAEGVGFEPTVPFRARLISSQVR
jgi:hypothetical protein